MKSSLWIVLPTTVLLLTACSPTGAIANDGNNQPSQNTASSTNKTAPSSNDVGNSTNSASATPSNTTPATGTSQTASASVSWINKVSVTSHRYTAPSQTINYPQVSGLPNVDVQRQINALLKKSAMYSPTEGYTDPKSYTFESYYNVVFQQGDIMSFLISSYFYPTGAAHGMPARTSLIVNLKSGQVYTLKDIFQPRSNYLNKVSHVVVRQDTSHALNTFRKFTGVTDKDTVYLAPGGFVVDFMPYEWASYAQGFLDYRVPFSSVDGALNKSGSFWQALHDKTGFPALDNEAKDQAKITSLGYVPSLAPLDSTTVAVGNGSYLSAWVGTKKSGNTASTTGNTYVFFFLNGKYLGTDTAKPHAWVSHVAPDGPGTISVTYDIPMATGSFTIHYEWTGTKLKMNDSFPSGYFGG